MRTYLGWLILIVLVLTGCRPAPTGVGSGDTPTPLESEAPALSETAVTPIPSTLESMPTASLLPSLSPTAAQDSQPSDPGQPGDIGISGDVLTSTLTNTVQIADLTVVQRGAVNQVAWSPDGDILAAATSSGVHLYRVDTLEKLDILDPAAHFLSLTFSPSGEELVLGGVDSKIYWWDPVDSKFLGFFDGHLLGVSALAFNSSGTMLASGSDDGAVQIWDTSLDLVRGFSSGESLFVFKPTPGRITRLSFAHDDRRLAIASFGGVHWVDTQTWETLEIFTPQSGLVNNLAISTDGRWLVSAGYDGLLQTLYLFGEGSPNEFDIGPDGEILALSYSPDNRYLAGGDLNGRVLLWGSPADDFVAVNANFSIVGEHQASISSLVFHPDGSRLASSSADGVVKIWQLPSLVQPTEGEN